MNKETTKQTATNKQKKMLRKFLDFCIRNFGFIHISCKYKSCAWAILQSCCCCWLWRQATAGAWTYTFRIWINEEVQSVVSLKIISFPIRCRLDENSRPLNCFMSSASGFCARLSMAIYEWAGCGVAKQRDTAHSVTQRERRNWKSGKCGSIRGGLFLIVWVSQLIVNVHYFRNKGMAFN